MNEELIGAAVTIETAGDRASLDLVVALMGDLLVAAEAPPTDLESAQADLRAALEGLEEAHGGSIARLTTELVLVTGGVEVTLQGTSSGVPARTVMCPA